MYVIISLNYRSTYPAGMDSREGNEELAHQHPACIPMDELTLQTAIQRRATDGQNYETCLLASYPKSFPEE